MSLVSELYDDGAGPDARCRARDLASGSTQLTGDVAIPLLHCIKQLKCSKEPLV